MALIPARLQWSPEGAPRSEDYGDIYFQRGQGAEESRYVFLQCNRLEERFAKAEGAFRVAELGFGTGLNFLLAAQLWARTRKPGARLLYAAVEKHPLTKPDMAKLHALHPELAEFSAPLLAQYPPPVEGFHHLHLPGIHLMLLYGDVADVLPQLSGTFDAWFLDGFSPEKNPDMWAAGLYPQIAARTQAGGTLSTFSAAGAVRQGLAAAGFAVEKVPGFGVKRRMTVAQMPGAPQTRSSPDLVTVAGAGLAGASAAHALAERGIPVRVCDPAPAPASGASGNPRGVLYPKLTVDPSPLGVFHLHAFCHARALVERLSLSSWRPSGVVMPDLDAEDAARTRELFARNGWPGELARFLPDVSAKEPLAGSGGGIFFPDAGSLSPPELVARLLDHPLIETRFGTRAENAETLVIAAGPALADFSQTKDLPLQTLRGQLTLAAATAQSRALRRILCHEGYILPEENGLHLLGATFTKEPPGDTALREAEHAENLEKLARHLPHLAVGEVAGGRASFRAATPDRLPLIGPAPDVAGFHAGRRAYHAGAYICAAFGAHGISGAPLAGEIVASLIAGDPLPVPQDLMAHLLPERFILRALKKKAGPSGPALSQ